MATITGKFHNATPLYPVGNNGAMKQNFKIMQESGKLAEFEVWKDKSTMIDNMVIGNTYEILFAVDGRYYQKKDGTDGYIQQLACISIKEVTKRSVSSEAKATNATSTEESIVQAEQKTDLPF